MSAIWCLVIAISAIFMYRMECSNNIVSGLHDAINCTKNILLSVPEHNALYENGLLYNFWIGYDGAIYGESFGIDIPYNLTQHLPKTKLFTPNPDEFCISISVDYVYNKTEISLMFNPLNIMFAASCKYCQNGNCTLPQWRIIMYNIDGDTFSLSAEVEVAAFDYTIPDTNDIFVKVQKFGDRGEHGVMFNALLTNITATYASRIYSHYIDNAKSYDVMVMANYDTFTLDFNGIYIPWLQNEPFYEYGMLTLSPYYFSLYPSSTAILDTDQSSNVFIHCHTELIYSDHSIACMVLYDDGQLSVAQQSWVSNQEDDVYEHNSLLITMDNVINENNNYPMTITDLSWAKHSDSDQYGKLIMVHETGHSIYAQLIEVSFVGSGGATMRVYSDIGEVPLNSYNSSYDPVVTTTPNGKYFIIAWATLERGIYATILGPEGVRIESLQSDDIVIYEDNTVNYTWLDIECIQEAVYITFIITDSSGNSWLQFKVIYITDYATDPATTLPATISSTTLSLTTSSATIASSTLTSSTTATSSTTVIDDRMTTEISDETPSTTVSIECIFKILIDVDMNTTIKPEAIANDERFGYQQLFTDTVIDELMEQYTVSELLQDSLYGYRMNKIFSSFEHKSWFHTLETLFCVNSDNDELFNELIDVFNASTFWNSAVQNDINQNIHWNDSNTKLNAIITSTQNSNLNDTKNDNSADNMLLIVILISILSCLLISAIGLIIYWFRYKRNIENKINAVNVEEKTKFTTITNQPGALPMGETAEGKITAIAMHMTTSSSLHSNNVQNNSFGKTGLMVTTHDDDRDDDLYRSGPATPKDGYHSSTPPAPPAPPVPSMNVAVHSMSTIDGGRTPGDDDNVPAPPPPPVPVTNAAFMD